MATPGYEGYAMNNRSNSRSNNRWYRARCWTAPCGPTRPSSPLWESTSCSGSSTRYGQASVPNRNHIQLERRGREIYDLLPDWQVALCLCHRPHVSDQASVPNRNTELPLKLFGIAPWQKLENSPRFSPKNFTKAWMSAPFSSKFTYKITQISTFVLKIHLYWPFWENLGRLSQK